MNAIRNVPSVPCNLRLWTHILCSVTYTQQYIINVCCNYNKAMEKLDKEFFVRLLSFVKFLSPYRVGNGGRGINLDYRHPPLEQIGGPDLWRHY